jgi:hypothetical protein
MARRKIAPQVTVRREKNENDYRALQTELLAIEARTGLYLADEGVDMENAGAAYDAPGFWHGMYAAATCAAGQRAEEAGLDINALLGRVIY